MFNRTNHFNFFSSKKSAFFNTISTNKTGELYLIRHAECEHNLNGYCAGYNNASIPTQRGIETTQKLGKILSNSHLKFNNIYMSPLRRVLITSRALLEDFTQTEITITEALAERNFGKFTGMSKAHIEKILGPKEFYKYIHDINFFPPDIEPGDKYFQSSALYGYWPNNHKGESYQCVINRVSPFLEEIQTKLRAGKNILIIGHSHNLQILQMLLYRDKFENGIEKYKLDYVKPVIFKFKLDINNNLFVESRSTLNLTEPRLQI